LERAKELCSVAQERKDREIRIKREDAIRFFNTKIREEEERLKDYRRRLFLGEDMAIAIRATERRVEDLKAELQRTLNRLEEEELVIERNPELISAAVILRKGYGDESM